MTASSSTVVVFYSWQSDLPPKLTRFFLLDCLKSAKKELETAPIPIVSVVIDEATREVTGAAHIPDTILAKIDAADLVVADVTTINHGAGDDFRPTPNPNVMMEVGFSVGRLGWERLVPVFNEAFGLFPGDLPFDLDKRRTVNYKLADTADPKSIDGAKRSLTAAFKAAILKVHSINPIRPSSQWATAVKRQRDVLLLTELCSSFDTDAVQRQCEDIQRGFVSDAVLYYFLGYQALIERLAFKLFDHKAETLAKALYEAWSAALPSPELTNQTDWGYLFKVQGSIPTEEETAELDRFETVAQPLYDALGAFLSHIHDEYVEIDLEATSRDARRARQQSVK